jgi:hypothetical protein
MFVVMVVAVVHVVDDVESQKSSNNLQISPKILVYKGSIFVTCQKKGMEVKEKWS